MTEEQLNENIIKNKIQGVCQDCIYLDKIVPIVNQMIKKEEQQLIKFLEDKIKEYESLIFENSLTASDNELLFYKQKLTAFQEVLDFVKGGKDEFNK